jgi:catechol 2,3-dioxygenase-like lactoylglutathione lyase family enzyme
LEQTDFAAKKLRTAMTGKRAGLDTLHHAALRVKDVKAAVEWYTQRFRCVVEYQDRTWAILSFANVRLAFVLREQHPPHIAVEGDPSLYGRPKQHRDGTSSVYLKDPDGNNVEILALPASLTAKSLDP